MTLQDSSLTLLLSRSWTRPPFVSRRCCRLLDVRLKSKCLLQWSRLDRCLLWKPLSVPLLLDTNRIVFVHRSVLSQNLRLRTSGIPQVEARLHFLSWNYEATSRRYFWHILEFVFPVLLVNILHLFSLHRLEHSYWKHFSSQLDRFDMRGVVTVFVLASLLLQPSA